MTEAPAPSAASVAAEVLSVQNLEAWYGESHILHGVNFNVSARRGGDPARPQRRRQDHDAEVGHGHHRQAHRLGPLQRSRDHPCVLRPDRADGHRLLPRGARHLRQPRRPGEPAAAAGGQAGRHVARADLRSVSQSEGAAEEPGHQAFRRRAADAGDRAHPAHRRQLPDAGRADRRPCARHHPADRRDHRAAQEGRASPSFWSSRISASPSTVADRYYVVEHGKIIDGFANSELQANMDKLHTYLGV